MQRKLDEVISNKESSDSHFKHFFEELTQSVEEYQETVEKQRKQIFLYKRRLKDEKGRLKTCENLLNKTKADAQRMRSQRDAAAQRLGDESERIRQVVNE